MVDTIGILLSCMNTIGNDESGIFLFALGVAWIAKLIQNDINHALFFTSYFQTSNITSIYEN